MIHEETPVIANSLWTATAGQPPYCPALSGDREADLVVIGCGFTGLSTALYAATRGFSVVALDTHTPGWGASGRNGGQVNPGLKNDPDHVIEQFGEHKGGRFADFAGSAGHRLFELVARHGIDCDVVRAGWIQTALNATGLAAAERRVQQWKQRGRELKLLDRKEVGALLGFDAYVGGTLDPQGGTVHPLKLAFGLCRAAQQGGARIHGKSRVTWIDHDASGVTVHTASGRVRTARVVICINGYGDTRERRDQPIGALSRSVVPVRSIQIASSPLPAGLRAQLMSGGHHASDTQRLMKYFRISPDGRFVIGGRGRRGEVSVRRDFQDLKQAAEKLCPDLAGIGWNYAWGGDIAVTLDGLPHLHEIQPRIAAALGYNGRGVALSIAMGEQLCKWAGGLPITELDMPSSSVRTIPFHGARNLGVSLAVAKYRLLDALGH